MLDKAREVLQIKRKYVTEVFELGLMPYTKRYLPSFDNHFSTIGVLGGNECCLNFFGEDISSVAGKNLMIETLKYIRDKEGREVDFVILKDNIIEELIEVKYNDDSLSKHLQYYTLKLKPKKSTQIVAGLKRDYDKNSIRVVSPLSYFSGFFNQGG